MVKWFSDRCRSLAETACRMACRILGMPEISGRKLRSFMNERGTLSGSACIPGERSSLALVVPCYGHAAYLGKMFESIVSQTRLPEQVIFVDDCSPDETWETLDKLISEKTIAQGPDFRLLRNSQNLGQAASLNLAVRAAETDLIMVLNDDDYLLHDAVEVMLHLFQRHGEVVLAGGHSLHFSGDWMLSGMPKKIAEIKQPGEIRLDVRYPEDVRHYRRCNDLNMTHSGSCFLKSAWETAGGYFPEKKKRLVPFSDRDFQLRVNSIFPVGVSAEVPFSCWRRDSSVDDGKNS
jgi:glycosyltransferase involved in cell wall biosynthesis